MIILKAKMVLFKDALLFLATPHKLSFGYIFASQKSMGCGYIFASQNNLRLLVLSFLISF